MGHRPGDYTRPATRRHRRSEHLRRLHWDSDLLPFIEHQLKESGADPANLVFEITETALMHDIAAGEAFAQGLAELGCGLALDDFGTGFGSFTYLKRLPISYLKIDIEFVRDLVTNPANQHVVRAIVSLAHAFGLQTIAEGVEDEATLQLAGRRRRRLRAGLPPRPPRPLGRQPPQAGDLSPTRRTKFASASPSGGYVSGELGLELPSDRRLTGVPSHRYFLSAMAATSPDAWSVVVRSVRGTTTTNEMDVRHVIDSDVDEAGCVQFGLDFADRASGYTPHVEVEPL